MTLIEALKTGKKIRKKGSGLYVNKDYPFTIDDILFNDWEVEPERPRFSKEECLVIVSSLLSAGIITQAAHDSFVHCLKEKE